MTYGRWLVVLVLVSGLSWVAAMGGSRLGFVIFLVSGLALIVGDHPARPEDLDEAYRRRVAEREDLINR